MICIRFRGIDDLEPCVRCVACRQIMRVSVAWIAFPALTANRTLSEGQWTHKTCADGNAIAVFQTKRLTLWRARDLLEMLLRSTE